MLVRKIFWECTACIQQAWERDRKQQSGSPSLGSAGQATTMRMISHEGAARSKVMQRRTAQDFGSNGSM